MSRNTITNILHELLAIAYLFPNYTIRSWSFTDARRRSFFLMPRFSADNDTMPDSICCIKLSHFSASSIIFIAQIYEITGRTHRLKISLFHMAAAAFHLHFTHFLHLWFLQSLLEASSSASWGDSLPLSFILLGVPRAAFYAHIYMLLRAHTLALVCYLLLRRHWLDLALSVYGRMIISSLLPSARWASYIGCLS